MIQTRVQMIPQGNKIEQIEAALAKLLADLSQRGFYGEAGLTLNAALRGPALAVCCRPDARGRSLLSRAVEVLGLTARGHARVLRVSRTIADLAGSGAVLSEHVAEAIQYRSTPGLDDAPAPLGR